ncbi:hypothetical protein [Cupriavidus plantarum]|uniref:hypothetical protein n=2 Tax=Cupriavidus plantarum TaxID=942865 RepID=UPI0011B2461B|nr:hypothetical protein [Cupriavidus plantarum]
MHQRHLTQLSDNHSSITLTDSNFGTAAADAIQVWLDVSSHPARGREQAGLIEEKLINKLIGDSGRKTLKRSSNLANCSEMLDEIFE